MLVYDQWGIDLDPKDERTISTNGSTPKEAVTLALKEREREERERERDERDR
jgi:hypothetical protein